MRTMRFLAVAAVTAALYGCAHQINVKQDSVSFSDKSNMIRLHAGLFLDEAARDFVYTKKRLGETYSFKAGPALEAEAAESLKKSFSDVAMLASKDDVGRDVQRIVELTIGPATEWQLGATTISKNTATVEIQCKVYDRKWNLLWSGSAQETVSKAVGVYGYMPALFGFFGQGPLYQAYGRIFNEALTGALEKLNDQILSEGRSSIAGS